ncbi:MAG: hypothetical protein Q7J44_20285 [Pseudotabrizicola sp.]|uniref:hypothetical protein n=1 Tax=Pseudotabrizicola sp. TaxID=2939647 RepID=UPI0027250F70|nr:hypothetical protein [Pseudotabrizicola sp.]MDO9640877.1 hypothetical protein [Pseudotabrizicola sp.]
MAYTLGEAEKVTGKSKATLSAAIKSGRIPARRDDSGTFHIDPAELHRIYPRTVYSDHRQAAAPLPDKTPEPPPEKGGLEAAISALQARLDATQDRLSDKETALADLREDRDRWRQQATALLAGHQPPKGLIARLFGR